jgi:hypothetical protein
MISTEFHNLDTYVPSYVFITMRDIWKEFTNRLSWQEVPQNPHTHTYYPVAGYKITYSVATLSYDNYYANLWDYNNSLLSGLLQHYGKYPHVLW